MKGDSFWDGYEKEIERWAASAGPLKVGLGSAAIHLFLLPLGVFMGSLAGNLLHGGGYGDSVRCAMGTFAVNARRYEAGNGDTRPLTRIQSEFKA